MTLKTCVHRQAPWERALDLSSSKNLRRVRVTVSSLVEGLSLPRASQGMRWSKARFLEMPSILFHIKFSFGFGNGIIGKILGGIKASAIEYFGLLFNSYKLVGEYSFGVRLPE